LGIWFCDGPFIVRTNLLTSAVKYFGTVLVVWFMTFWYSIGCMVHGIHLQNTALNFGGNLDFWKKINMKV
jgi:hypothetical protein